MKRQAKLAVWLVLAVVTAACGAVSPPRQAEPGSGSSAPTVPKSLTMASAENYGPLISNLFGGGMNYAVDVRPAVHQYLAVYDHRTEIHPQLATDLPSQAAGTWTVRPNGTMQTTYRIHPTVTWHDGAPLTTRDMAFAWRVTSDREIPLSRRGVAERIFGVETPDDLTLVIEWNQPYPFANAIVEEDLGPFPWHILQSLFEADKKRFAEASYWTREFVGVGPYRLDAWEPGSHLVLKAYDGFHRGRPKIDTLTVRFMPSSPTVLANLLAGSLDGVLSGIDLDQALVAREEWERAGRKPVLIADVDNARFMSVQFRDPRPKYIMDVRLRQGLLHALDRQAMADVRYMGYTSVMDSFFPPMEVKGEWVKDVVTRYDYNLPRARGLLEQAGWRPGGDGTLVTAAGERLGFPVWTTGGESSAKELALIGDYWKAAGVDVEQVVLGTAQTRDGELRASFPAFDVTAISIFLFEQTVARLHSSSCPTEQTRWAGVNRGCHQNRDWDRIADALTSAIDPADQRRLHQELMRHFSQELPLLPLYFMAGAKIFREGVTGPKGTAREPRTLAWNIAEWDVR